MMLTGQLIEERQALC